MYGPILLDLVLLVVLICVLIVFVYLVPDYKLLLSE